MNVPDRFCSPGAFYEYGENGMRPWRDGVHVGGGSLASRGSLHQGVKHVRRRTDGQLSQIGDVNTLELESKGNLDLKDFHFKQIYNTLTDQQRLVQKTRKGSHPYLVRMFSDINHPIAFGTKQVT